MASHLSITTTTAGTAATKSFGGTAGAEEGTPDIFAALLGAAGKPAETVAAASEAMLDAGLAAPSFGFDGEGTGEDADPEAIAAVLDAPAAVETPAQPEISDIIDELAALQARLAAGEPLDAETLDRLDTALTELARSLGIALTSPRDLAAPLATPMAEGDSFEARLTAALAPFAEPLLAAGPTADAEQTAALKSVTDKLASLLAGLAPPTEAPEPVLAAPELKLTEKVLTGKAAATTDTAATEPESADSAKTPTARSEDSAQPRPDERKPAEPRAAAAAPADKQPEPPSAAQPAPAARVDLVAAPRVVQVGYQTSQQQLNLPQLAFELVRQVQDGNTRFQIRLDPPELGKIDVRLDIDASGKVNARLTVEKAETLDLMQRDQRGLERALQQAGLDGARTSLEFSLRQNPFSGGQRGQDGADGQPIFGGEASAEAEEAPAPTIHLYRGALSASGVNIIA